VLEKFTRRRFVAGYEREEGQGDWPWPFFRVSHRRYRHRYTPWRQWSLTTGGLRQWRVNGV
jgi:hypothetical protein